MILIHTNNFENTTDNVIEWLISLKSPFVRINIEDELQEIELRMDHNGTDVTLTYKGNPIKFNTISGYWYRRGGIPNVMTDKSDLTGIFSKNTIKDINSHLTREQQKLKHFFYTLLENVPNKIGSHLHADPSKLHMLYIANKLGIDTPLTVVTTRKEKIVEAKKEYGRLITKAIHNLVISEQHGKRYIFYTEEVTDDVIETIPDHLFPSLIQEKLDKLYELRIFYLAGVFYPMVIFSQADSQTEVDFRNYNFEKPNRNVPYNLPEDLERKLNMLMHELHMESGSIDVVVTKDKRYVFLEVNPVGQFAQVTGPCNYNLYKIIAEYLTKKN